MSWWWGRRSQGNDKEEDEEGDEDDSSYDEDQDYDSEEYTDDDDDDDDDEDDEAEEENNQVLSPQSGDGSMSTPVLPLSSMGGPTPNQTKEDSRGLIHDHDSKGEQLPIVTSSPVTTAAVAPSMLPPPPHAGEITTSSTTLGKSHHSSEYTLDDDASLIESIGWQSKDDRNLESSHSYSDESNDDEEEEEEECKVTREKGTRIEGMEKVLPVAAANVSNQTTAATKAPSEDKSGILSNTTTNNNNDHHNDVSGKEDEEEEDVPTTFWEKQSLLVLAAEHDRVDILRGILSSDEDDHGGDGGDRSRLMNSGIPPLHLAIHFGSVNTTQTLLRMGADPSIRPNVALVKKQAKEAPKGQTLDIPKIDKFDGVTAWELAFGNEAYAEHQQTARSAQNSWSMFPPPSPSSNSASAGGNMIVRPVDMAPSKREGIRHAFTAEALRCIGGDEVDRLTQLLKSGMPPSIDIGGKDLYEWSVQLGGMKCEELLRPVEALKYGTAESNSEGLEDVSLSSGVAEPKPTASTMNGNGQQIMSSGKVIDRPGHEMTVPLLFNRLDELESLASALSTCLDSLAEEVSVCHGLLLMGGGASALAAHVKSLKTLHAQRRDQLDSAQRERETSEVELARAINMSGSIGEDVSAMSQSSALLHDQVDPHMRALDNNDNDDDDDDDDDDSDPKKRQQLLAQIAASENKIMKLRASIADLSEENVKEMEQVKQRGLLGGINLVRNLRDELRDLEFQWNTIRNRTATCRAQIGLIHSRMPKSETKEPRHGEPESLSTGREAGSPVVDTMDRGDHLFDDKYSKGKRSESDGSHADDGSGDSGDGKVTKTNHSAQKIEVGNGQGSLSGNLQSKLKVTTVHEDSKESASPLKPKTPTTAMERTLGKALPGRAKTTVLPDRISSGDSQAIVVRPAGNRGFFPLDLWQVLLRIVGFNQAATRRAIQVATKKKATPANLMIV